MKKLALLALLLPTVVLVNACTDAGDPYLPAVIADATVTLNDMVGDWDNLHLNGALTGNTPVAMTQDGTTWTATVANLEAGTYGYGVFYEDGTKALLPVLENRSLTIDEAGDVSGDTAATLEPAGGTGFNLVLYNNNPAYDDIKFKGAYTDDGWATVDRTGENEALTVFYRHIDAGLAEGNYEWGALDDDGTEWGVWLIDGDNPSFDVDATGAVSGTTTYTVAAPPPSADVTIILTDYVGDYDNLHVDGALTGDTPVAFSQDGYFWTATVAEVPEGDFAYAVFHDDGSKIMVEVLGSLSITVDATFAVSGDTEIELLPAAGTGFNLTVINNNPAFDNIKFKGDYTDDGWATIDRTGMSADGVYVYRHVEAGLAEASYEWGLIHDDGSEWGVWLIEGSNPSFDVAADGVVTGTTSYTIPAPAGGQVDVTFEVDMTAETVDGPVNLAGGFGADGYVEWQPGGILMTDIGDNVYQVVLTLTANTEYQFTFINGASWDGQESVPSECGVDNGVSGGFNRILTPGDSPVTYHAAFGACPE